MAGANIMRFRKLTLNLGRVEAGSQNNDVQFNWFKVSLFPNVIRFYLATSDRQETDTPPEKKNLNFLTVIFQRRAIMCYWNCRWYSIAKLALPQGISWFAM